MHPSTMPYAFGAAAFLSVAVDFTGGQQASEVAEWMSMVSGAPLTHAKDCFSLFYLFHPSQ